MRREDFWMLWFTGAVAVLWAFASMIWLLSTNDRVTTTTFTDWLKIIVALPGFAGITAAEYFQRRGLPEGFGLVVALLVSFGGSLLLTLGIARWSRG